MSDQHPKGREWSEGWPRRMPTKSEHDLQDGSTLESWGEVAVVPLSEAEARLGGVEEERDEARRELAWASENRDALWVGEHTQRNRAIAAESQLAAVREWAMDANELGEDPTDTELMRDPYSDAAREVLRFLDQPPSEEER